MKKKKKNKRFGSHSLPSCEELSALFLEYCGGRICAGGN
jgi:hypothetical protein